MFKTLVKFKTVCFYLVLNRRGLKKIRFFFSLQKIKNSKKKKKNRDPVSRCGRERIFFNKIRSCSNGWFRRGQGYHISSRAGLSVLTLQILWEYWISSVWESGIPHLWGNWLLSGWEPGIPLLWGNWLSSGWEPGIPHLWGNGLSSGWEQGIPHLWGNRHSHQAESQCSS